LMDCLIEQKSFSREKKTTEVKLSSKMPEIAEDISKVDLNSWFNIEDLRDWCKEKNISNGGTKKDLIDRIFAYFGRSTSGKPLTGRAKEKRKSFATTSRRAAKKARTEVSTDVSSGLAKEGDNAVDEPEEIGHSHDAIDPMVNDTPMDDVAAPQDSFPTNHYSDFLDEIADGYQFSTLGDFQISS